MTLANEPIIAGRYRLGPLVGAGGMGIVYCAEDLRDGGEVAVKLVHPDRIEDAAATGYLRGESRAIGRIRHHNVVAVLAGGVTDDAEPYLVMELVRGRSLRDLIHDDGPLSVMRASKIVRQVLAGIDAIHDAGFVHGDVKADNVLIDDNDDITLIDLGLMRCLREVDHDGYASGTPDYMPPEVIRGEPAIVGSDLYSVGALLYELLTGAPPFTGGSSCAILCRHLEDDVVLPSLRCPERQFSRGIESVVLCALEKRPEHRFASARSFAEALRSATPATEQPTAATQFTPTMTHAATADWNPPTAQMRRRFAAGTRPPGYRR